MKGLLKRCSMVGAFLVLSAMLVTGCSNGGKGSEAEEVLEDPVYPVTLDGSEILIGETTVQTLLDKGLRITVSEMSENYEITHYEIDPEAELEANSYYSGGSVWITDKVFANISIVTDEENVKMGDAVIAYLEFSLSDEDATGLDKILFNGVSVAELSREKAGEMFPDFTGDENMWFSPASITDYKYFMAFNSDGRMTKFSVEKKYDVDWSGEE